MNKKTKASTPNRAPKCAKQRGQLNPATLSKFEQLPSWRTGAVGKLPLSVAKRLHATIKRQGAAARPYKSEISEAGIKWLEKIAGWKWKAEPKAG